MSELQKSVENRIIQIFCGGEAINIATNANKWSDIIPLIENNENGFKIAGKKAVLGSTKGVLQLPDALIPDGNQAIFLVQDKMKSGATEKPFEDIAYVDLRRLAKDKGITGLGSSPKRDDLINALRTATGIKELKSNSKVNREIKAEVVKKTKEKVIELRPDLEERIESLEKILGDAIEGFGNILDSLRGRDRFTALKSTNEIPEPKAETKESFGQGTSKIKTKDELQAEFSSLKF